jgi:hypothetical protein
MLGFRIEMAAEIGGSRGDYQASLKPLFTSANPYTKEGGHEGEILSPENRSGWSSLANTTGLALLHNP